MKRYSALFLMSFIALNAPALAAQKAPAEQLPAHMTDDELVSYLNGRLDAALKAEGYKVSKSCTQNGCDIIVE